MSRFMMDGFYPHRDTPRAWYDKFYQALDRYGAQVVLGKDGELAYSFRSKEDLAAFERWTLADIQDETGRGWDSIVGELERRGRLR